MHSFNSLNTTSKARGCKLLSRGKSVFVSVFNFFSLTIIYSKIYSIDKMNSDKLYFCRFLHGKGSPKNIVSKSKPIDFEQ